VQIVQAAAVAVSGLAMRMQSDAMQQVQARSGPDSPRSVRKCIPRVSTCTSCKSLSGGSAELGSYVCWSSTAPHRLPGSPSFHASSTIMHHVPSESLMQAALVCIRYVCIHLKQGSIVPPSF